MIGSFHQPQCVIADTNTLNTLDNRQLSSGIAEIIKYALINSVVFFDWLQDNVIALMNRNPEALAYAINFSCQDKATIVAADEKEQGQRALLNLGHTFGHAIETALGYGNCLHGEAIAIGMVMAADLSVRHGWITTDSQKKITKLLEKANLPVRLPGNEKSISVSEFMKLMQGDKKVLDGQLNLILLNKLGNSFITSNFDKTKLQQTLAAFASA